jgi:DNA-binding winged helix-turn-helix (wHTH) protein
MALVGLMVSTLVIKSFQSFRLDTSNHCLWHAEERVPIPPKTFDVLRYLVDHPGRLVTRDEILEEFWQDTYVSPEVLRRYIREIRKILGDRLDQPVFIETVPKRGYRFVAPVDDECSAGLVRQTAWTSPKLGGQERWVAELDGYLSRAN